MLNQNESKSSVLSFRTSEAKRIIVDEAAKRENVTRAQWLERMFEKQIDRLEKQMQKQKAFAE